jgi:CheY-like chemotaxis protein
MRILYVEDNPANLFLVQRVARMGNHEVLNYTNGESALENFERDHPDLVLMDVQLAGNMSGLDVVRKLRGSGYKTPIVAVTAYAMIGDRERCLEAGCDDYLAKPLPVPKLVEIIRRYDPVQGLKPAVEPAPISQPVVELSQVTQPSRPTQELPKMLPVEPLAAPPAAPKTEVPPEPAAAEQSAAAPVTPTMAVPDAETAAPPAVDTPAPPAEPVAVKAEESVASPLPLEQKVVAHVPSTPTESVKQADVDPDAKTEPFRPPNLLPKKDDTT